MGIEKIINRIIPIGIIRLYEYVKYIIYKASFRKQSLNNAQNGFDIILSLGKSCRPAHYLKINHLRFCSSPLDWMSGYSLDTAFHLLSTKFNDFFISYYEKEDFTSFYNSKCYVDKLNTIGTIHYDFIETENKRFIDMMKKRGNNIYNLLVNADDVLFLCHRKEKMEKIQEFLYNIRTIIKGNITLINICSDKNSKGITKTETNLNDNIKYVEYLFNDTNKGSNKKENPNAWLGNEYYWNYICKGILLKRKLSFREYR